jgi:hypothetical protein
MPPRKARQRSLRKTRVSSDDEDVDDVSQTQSVTQAADIIAARKHKKKEARKQALLGGNTAVGSIAHGAPVDMMAGRTADEYSSMKKMNEMAKEMNVTISGSFRKGQLDDGRVSLGFQRRGDVCGDGDEVHAINSDGEHGHNDMIDVQETTGAAIPDEETIRKARQRRELLRNGEPDFIPLQEKAGVPSRVERYKFDCDEAAKDESSFVREQIEKGLRTMAIRQQARQRAGQPGENGHGLDIKSLDATTLADDILNQMNMRLERVTTTLKQHEHGIARTSENLTDTVKRLFEDEKILQDLSDEFEKAQEMRGYVRALCSMLYEKSPILEELQHQSLQSRKEHARALLGAFETATKGEQFSASKGIEAATKVLLGGGDDDAARLAAAEAAAEADESLRSGDHIPVELDEFGRDMNMERRMMVQKGTAVSDIASKAERAFSTRQEDIRLELKNVFADTDEHFASLSAVRNRLESWKASFSNQYDATFMGLSAPALFAPFVRLELIRWDPLASQSFTKHQWYSLLFDYGAQSPECDPDHQVIPSLVAQIVLPWISDIVRDVWDPTNNLSLSLGGQNVSSALQQCRALSSAVADVLVHYDSGNKTSYKSVCTLLDAISDKLGDAVTALAVDTPSWLPSAIAVTERAQLCRETLFERATALLSCVCCFADVLPGANVDGLVEPLSKTVLQLLRSYVASAPACADKASQVCAALGSASGTGGSALRALLESVRDLLLALNRNERSVSTALASVDSLL